MPVNNSIRIEGGVGGGVKKNGKGGYIALGSPGGGEVHDTAKRKVRYVGVGTYLLLRFGQTLTHLILSWLCMGSDGGYLLN